MYQGINEITFFNQTKRKEGSFIVRNQLKTCLSKKSSYKLKEESSNDEKDNKSCQEGWRHETEEDLR